MHITVHPIMVLMLLAFGSTFIGTEMYDFAITTRVRGFSVNRLIFLLVLIVLQLITVYTLGSHMTFNE